MSRALDLGSGHNPVERTGWWKEGDVSKYDFTSLDLYHEDSDCRHDLNEIPYPFGDNTFDVVFARHSLEHIHRDKFIDAMREIHRVAKDRALIYVRVPYWNSEAYAGDPTHWNPMCETTFRHFCYGSALNTDSYIPQLFEIVEVGFLFQPKFKFLPRSVLKELMHVLSGVCDEIFVLLRAIKTPPYPEIYDPAKWYKFTQVPTDKGTLLLYGVMFYGLLGLLVAAVAGLFI